MPQDNGRLAILFIIIFIFIITPDGSNQPVNRIELDDVLALERHNLNVLRNSTFGNYGNYSGVHLIPGSAVKTRVDHMRKAVLGTGPLGPGHLPLLYHNVSGFVQGDWNSTTIENWKPPPLNQTDYLHNLTETYGQFMLSFDERDPYGGEKSIVDRDSGLFKMVRVTVEFLAPDGTDTFGTNVVMWGVHSVKTGFMMFTTSSSKFAGIFSLPHFASKADSFNETKVLLEPRIAKAIKDQDDSVFGTSPFWLPQNVQNLFNEELPRCEYVAYLQMHPITGSSQDQSTIDLLESELRWPTGAPVPKPPPMKLSGLIYSPDCGIAVEINGAEGIKIDAYYLKASTVALISAVITVIQVWLLVRQMYFTSTPSTISKLSIYTFGIMSLSDGFMVMGFIFAAIVIQSAFLPLVSVAFLQFILVSVFGMRYLVTIYGVQAPEREARAAILAASRPTAGTPSEQTSLLPTVNPTPAVAPAPPVTVAATPTPAAPPPQTSTQAASALFTRFYFLLLGTVFLTLHSLSWPLTARHLFHRMLVLLSTSFWAPQIYRNAYRNSRKALSWEFVIGTSVCRTLGIVYIYTCPKNVLYADGDEKIVVVMYLWLGLQMGVLWSQDKWGGRWFVPRGILPEGYDYHPVLDDDELRSESVDAVSDEDVERGGDAALEGGTRAGECRRKFDCAICMQSVEVLTKPSPKKGEEKAKVKGKAKIKSDDDQAAGEPLLQGSQPQQQTKLSKMDYMVTPCRHVYHTECLEGWLKYRLQCPICRNPLPPL